MIINCGTDCSDGVVRRREAPRSPLWPRFLQPTTKCRQELQTTPATSAWSPRSDRWRRRASVLRSFRSEVVVEVVSATAAPGSDSNKGGSGNTSRTPWAKRRNPPQRRWNPGPGFGTPRWPPFRPVTLPVWRWSKRCAAWWCFPPRRSRRAKKVEAVIKRRAPRRLATRCPPEQQLRAGSLFSSLQLFTPPLFVVNFLIVDQLRNCSLLFLYSTGLGVFIFCCSTYFLNAPNEFFVGFFF